MSTTESQKEMHLTFFFVHVRCKIDSGGMKVCEVLYYLSLGGPTWPLSLSWLCVLWLCVIFLLLCFLCVSYTCICTQTTGCLRMWLSIDFKWNHRQSQTRSLSLQHTKNDSEQRDVNIYKCTAPAPCFIMFKAYTCIRLHGVTVSPCHDT